VVSVSVCAFGVDEGFFFAETDPLSVPAFVCSALAAVVGEALSDEEPSSANPPLRAD
jgi:hypothetical protein